MSFRTEVTFYFDSLNGWNPSLIAFRAYTSAGEPLQLIQDVSRISVLFMTLRKLAPQKRVGFRQRVERTDVEL